MSGRFRIEVGMGGDQKRTMDANGTTGLHVGYFVLPSLSVAGERVRPGISYSRAIDDPLAGGDYQIVQLDVPVIF